MPTLGPGFLSSPWLTAATRSQSKSHSHSIPPHPGLYKGRIVDQALRRPRSDQHDDTNHGINSRARGRGKAGSPAPAQPAYAQSSRPGRIGRGRGPRLRAPRGGGICTLGRRGQTRETMAVGKGESTLPSLPPKWATGPGSATGRPAESRQLFGKCENGRRSGVRPAARQHGRRLADRTCHGWRQRMRGTICLSGVSGRIISVTPCLYHGFIASGVRGHTSFPNVIQPFLYL